MNVVDLAVFVVIAISAVFAFARGFVREALSIMAWAGAALITLYGFTDAAGIVSRFVRTPLLADLVAGAGLFLISLIGLTILTGYVAGRVKSSALSPIDRTLGLIFGVLRGAVLVSLAYLVIDSSLPQTARPRWLQDAKSEPFLAEGADLLRGLMPQSLQMDSASAIDGTRHALSRAEEARDAMGALSSPTAALPPKPPEPPAPAYKPAEQRGLDRLIDNAR